MHDKVVVRASLLAVCLLTGAWPLLAKEAPDAARASRKASASQGANTAVGELADKGPLPKVERQFPAIELLPAGTVLKNVRLPRYKNYQLSGLLLADQMKVISANELSGEQVRLQLVRPQGRQATLQFGQARYLFAQATLHATQGVQMNDVNFSASGSRMVLNLDKQQGFLVGPVKTSLVMPSNRSRDSKQTSSNPSLQHDN